MTASDILLVGLFVLGILAYAIDRLTRNEP